MSAQDGIVTSQASRISRTTGQRTCRRRCAAPTPTTEDATTWVVLTGAPRNADTPITPALEPWLTRPSSGRMR